MTVQIVLYLVALLLVLVSFFKSEWPLVTIALLLVIVAGLVPALAR